VFQLLHHNTGTVKTRSIRWHVDWPTLRYRRWLCPAVRPLHQLPQASSSSSRGRQRLWLCGHIASLLHNDASVVYHDNNSKVRLCACVHGGGHAKVIGGQIWIQCDVGSSFTALWHTQTNCVASRSLWLPTASNVRACVCVCVHALNACCASAAAAVCWCRLMTTQNSPKSIVPFPTTNSQHKHAVVFPHAKRNLFNNEDNVT